MDNQTIKDAVIQAFGGTHQSVADALSEAFPNKPLTREGVWMWKRIPGERVLQIHALKPKLTPKFLRPDVYEAVKK